MTADSANEGRLTTATSTALLTDRYELTMLDAALTSGTHQRDSVFEVFARRLPSGRRYGVVAGTGRLLELIRDFRFTPEHLDWLANEHVVSDRALALLADYRFEGEIDGYAEGELYFPNSPVLSVRAPFWQGVILETLILSVLNYDCAVASAAARMAVAAGGRPLAEMGSRRTQERSAVGAARAAYIAGFSATSNLEAGFQWGVPTMGTAAHSFTLLHDSEAGAFRAQIDTLGVGTTLLVDTYDIEQGVRTAIEVAGTDLGAVRIDSGDLPVVVRQVRTLLDSLGATNTKITVTNDLDEHAIAGLAAAPVDSYGVGTQVVTGAGHPAAGMVYKLVARRGDDGEWLDVAKSAAGKSNAGGLKQAFRRIKGGTATHEVVHSVAGADANAPLAGADHDDRPLLVNLASGGEYHAQFLGQAGVQTARERCAESLAELPRDGLRLSAGDPAIPTVLN